MAYFHGISTSQVPTSVSTPVVADTGIPFVIGTAPVHTVGGKSNELILANSYSEAVAALGYSDDWKKYTLCEVIYSQFKLYGRAPVIFVNVLDSENHNKNIDTAEYNITKGKIELPLETIANSVVVKSATTGGTEYTEDTDYSIYYSDNALIIEVNETGALKEAASAFVSYTQVDSTAVTKQDIIGGYDVNTGKTTGLELIENCFAKFQIIPDLLLAPGYSSDSEVAAVLATKASINGLFKAKALIDIDTKTVKKYTDVNVWKSNNNITDKNQIACYPMATLSERVFHASTIVAGTMAVTDYDNDDCPCESPSNNSAKIDGMCLEDGTEIILNITQANYLNSIGVVTFLNFVGGFNVWGNETACYPSNTDVKDYFINVSRMFDWVNNNFILSFWEKIDGNITRRLIDSIVDSFNLYLNGLTSAGKILGGRIEFDSSENDVASLMSGVIKVHTYLTPPSPGKEIVNTFEYDVDYIESFLES
ncbi:MAG: phage tail protein [Clostridia bacterium]|nr:phage tail protein [Clostridia bacterium]